MADSNSPPPEPTAKALVPDVSRYRNPHPGAAKPSLPAWVKLPSHAVPVAPVAKRPPKPVHPAVAAEARASHAVAAVEARRLQPKLRWLRRKRVIVLILAALILGLPALMAAWKRDANSSPVPPSPVPPSPRESGPADEPSMQSSAVENPPSRELEVPIERDDQASQAAAPAASPESASRLLDAASDTASAETAGVAQLEGVIIKPILKASHDRGFPSRR